MLKNGGLNKLSFFRHSIGPSLRRNIIFPLYWKYIRNSNLLKCYYELKAHQWNSLEENKKIQRKKLFNLIHYASRNIAYYQRVISEGHIRFSEESIFEDIKKFPLLTKEIVRNEFNELYKFRDNTYYQNVTGGSTGKPVKLYQDMEYFGWAAANKILLNEWAGKKVGDPMVKLWGSTRDILKGGRGFRGYLREKFSGIIMLQSDRMTEDDLYEYVWKINHVKPVLILAFTNSINELARFIQEHHLSVYSPSAVMTTAGVLYPEVRERIIDVFHTRAFNRYGSQEVSDIACNCEKNEGLHLNGDIHYVEIVDDDGREVDNGTAGNILVSLLTNYTMPLVRYKIEDRGILSKKPCSCGRGLPLLEKVEGRVRGNFKNKFGDCINGGVFMDLFYSNKDIKQFQFIQEAYDHIMINLVMTEKKNIKNPDQHFKEINQKIYKIMGHKIKIEYNIVKEIIPSPSGKYFYFYSKVNE